MVPTSSAKAPYFGIILLFVNGVLNVVAWILLLCSMLRISGSIQIMNNAQLKASPCLTHLRILIMVVL